MATNNALNNDIQVAVGTSLNLGSSTTMTGMIDDDTFATASASTAASSESIKAYVDAQISTSGGIQSVQVFTASGTWNKPVGINKVVVECVGGGGGGAGISSTTSQAAIGGGGGYGGYSKILIDVSAISSETVTIGAAGAGGAAGANDGSAGGTSSFGAHVSCTGGAGGINTPSAAADRGCIGGLGGVGSGGDINGAGAHGGGSTLALGGGVSGAGGSGIYGSGSLPRVQNTSGNTVGGDGVGFGAGGSGAIGLNSIANLAGGNGTAGVIIIWEYS